MTSLTPLIDLIVQNARVLEAACASPSGDGNASLPDLTVPFDPASEAFRKDPKAAEAANVIAAAAFQLAATVLPPPSTLLGVAEAVSEGGSVSLGREKLIDDHVVPQAGRFACRCGGRCGGDVARGGARGRFFVLCILQV